MHPGIPLTSHPPFHVFRLSELRKSITHATPQTTCQIYHFANLIIWLIDPKIQALQHYMAKQLLLLHTCEQMYTCEITERQNEGLVRPVNVKKHCCEKVTAPTQVLALH